MLCGLRENEPNCRGGIEVDSAALSVTIEMFKIRWGSPNSSKSTRDSRR